MTTHGSKTISLFPMFNILTCTLGVLVFILTAVVGISIGAGKVAVIVPESVPAGVPTKSPLFLTWNGSDLAMVEGGHEVAFPRYVEDIKTYAETYEYMTARIRGTPLEMAIARAESLAAEEYVFVLIRPSGFESFDSIKGFVQTKGIDIGYEPIDQYLTVTTGGRRVSP